MNESKAYVLVTPVRDEAATIGRTIDAVVSQSLPPHEWVIVNDGSTDGTDAIVREASGTHPWIRLLSLPPRPIRSFAAVVHNTEAGVRHLKFQDFKYLGLLDADVVFQRDYYEQIIRRFEDNPRLGLAGGVVIDVGRPPNRLPKNRRDVPGAVQLFRSECYGSLGGLMPIPEGGWDGMTCAVARMKGYETQLFTDLVVDHLKPRNISEGGVIRRKWQMGIRDHALGYHPAFEVVKCIGRLTEPPWIVGAVAWLGGYCTGLIQDRPRIVPDEVVRFVRTEQIERLKSEVGFRTA